MSTDRTIVLKGDPLRYEGVANAAITPGHLIEEMSTGKLRKHATAGGNAAKLFAIENALEGQEVGDDYSAADQVQYVAARPGDEIQAWLADGENVSIGDPLESNGDGTLRKHTPRVESSALAGQTEYLNVIVGFAREALNLAATTSLTDTRIRIRVA